MSAAAVMRRSNRRSTRGTSSVACFTGVLAGLVVLRPAFAGNSRQWMVASVLLNASCEKVKHFVAAIILISRVCTRTERLRVGAGLLHASADKGDAEI